VFAPPPVTASGGAIHSHGIYVSLLMVELCGWLIRKAAQNRWKISGFICKTKNPAGLGEAGGVRKSPKYRFVNYLPSSMGSKLLPSRLCPSVE
jgi:hypothetical protein